MDTQTTTIICRLCLKLCDTDNFNAIDGNIKDLLDALLPKIDLAAIQQSVMCTYCTKKLIKCYDFKKTFLHTKDYIFPFIKEDAIKLDLRDLYQSKDENNAVTEDQEICGFCMTPVKRCSAIYLNFEEGDVAVANMIEQCLPELDFNVIDKPVICGPCYGLLEDYFHFMKSCLIVEEKIKEYCESVDIDSKDQIELSSLLEYKISDVKTEADGNLDDIIKIESKEGINKLDVIKMEEMSYGENEFKVENHNQMEDQKFLEEVDETETKANDSNFNRFEDGILTHAKYTIPNLEGDLFNPNVKQNASKMYQCDCCSFQTKRKQHFSTHLLRHKDPSEVTMYKCDYCSYLTKYKSCLKTHLQKHKDPSEVTMHKCDFCSYQAKQKGNLKLHLLKHKDPSQLAPYKCDSCSYQTVYQTNFHTHLLKHKDSSEVAMYKCDSCSYQTKYKNHIKAHLLRHQDPSEGALHNCDFCSYQTKQKGTLKMHLLRHKDPSQLTMYKCEFCQYQTKYKHYIKIHLLQHKDPSEVAMYQCDFCSYQAKQKGTLKTHLLTHKDSAQLAKYKCDTCSYQTVYKNNLQKHLQKHMDPSEITVYKCASCSFQTRYKNALKRHLQKRTNCLK